MTQITIAEKDPLVRRVLEEALAARGIENVRVMAEETAGSLIFPLPMRLGAVLDRIARLQRGNTQKTIKIGPYRLDTAHNTLSGGKKDKILRLTEKETAILAFLAAQKGAFVTRERLLQEIWGYADGVETHTLETHIYRLRRKIEDDAANPEILLTSEQGYSLSL